MNLGSCAVIARTGLWDWGGFTKSWVLWVAYSDSRWGETSETVQWVLCICVEQLRINTSVFYDMLYSFFGLQVRVVFPIWKRNDRSSDICVIIKMTRPLNLFICSAHYKLHAQCQSIYFDNQTMSPSLISVRFEDIS